MPQPKDSANNPSWSSETETLEATSRFQPDGNQKSEAVQPELSWDEKVEAAFGMIEGYFSALSKLDKLHNFFSNEQLTQAIIELANSFGGTETDITGRITNAIETAQQEALTDTKYSSRVNTNFPAILVATRSLLNGKSAENLDDDSALWHGLLVEALLKTLKSDMDGFVDRVSAIDEEKLPSPEQLDQELVDVIQNRLRLFYQYLAEISEKLNPRDSRHETTLTLAKSAEVNSTATRPLKAPGFDMFRDELQLLSDFILSLNQKKLNADALIANLEEVMASIVHRVALKPKQVPVRAPRDDAKATRFQAPQVPQAEAKPNSESRFGSIPGQSSTPRQIGTEVSRERKPSSGRLSPVAEPQEAKSQAAFPTRAERAAANHIGRTQTSALQNRFLQETAKPAQESKFDGKVASRIRVTENTPRKETAVGRVFKSVRQTLVGALDTPKLNDLSRFIEKRKMSATVLALLVTSFGAVGVYFLLTMPGEVNFEVTPFGEDTTSSTETTQVYTDADRIDLTRDWFDVVNDPRVAIHFVQEGETLSIIADKYGLSLDQLLQLNPNITNPNVIYADQVILIDGDVLAAITPDVALDVSPVETNETPPPAPTAESEEAAPAAPAEEGLPDRNYPIVIWSVMPQITVIANEVGVDVDVVVQAIIDDLDQSAQVDSGLPVEVALMALSNGDQAVGAQAIGYIGDVAVGLAEK